MNMEPCSVQQIAFLRWMNCLRHRQIFQALLGSLAFICFASTGALAQYRFDSWTTDNGLPQNSVYAITQTRDGYLWLTTVDGLVRFDGVRFTVFDQTTHKGLPSNRFTSLYEDREGTLWIGTEEGQLIAYRDGVFTAYTLTGNTPLNLIRTIQEASDGTLVLMTRAGVAHWRNGQLVAFPDGTYYQIIHEYRAPSGSHWIWDQAGLHQFKEGRKTTYPLPLKLFKNLSADLYEDAQGTLWASQGDPGTYRIKDGIVTTFTEKDGFPKTLGVWKILADQQGNVWFATEGGGLVQYKDQHFNIYTTANGLSSNTVRTIYEDREGTIWLGTLNGGLNRLTRQIIKTYSMQNGLAGNNVYPIYQDHAGTIWVGGEGGLSRFTNGNFTTYKFAVTGERIYSIQTLCGDSQGRLWFANYSLTGWLHNGKVVTPPEFPRKRAYQAIYEDREGTLWFGTDQGLLKYRNDTVTTYTTKDGLLGNDVKVIYQDRQGSLWFGTYGGLARLTDGRISAYTMADGLGSNRVRSLYEDAEGTLWIGTYDGGLTRYKEGRFTTYTVTNGLFNNGVFQILEDNSGNLWMSCNRGIYRVSKQQLNDFADGRIPAITCIAYGKLDGMLNTECNGGRQPAGLKARDGKLWFPTLGGAVVVEPEAVPFNSQPPPVLIETVTLDRNSVAFGEGVQIAPGQANLEIDFTGLSHVKSEQMRFKYKLIGQDQDWIDTGTRRSANYSYLAPGKYTFVVLAANSDGVWNTTGASLEIIVIPPFYRTWWFLSLLTIVVIGLVFFIYQGRIWQLQRRQMAQETFSRQLIESQEAERQRIAAELHDSLGQNLLVIKNRALLGLALSKEDAPKEQFDEITASVSEALNEVRSIAYNLRPLHLERLGLTSTLEEMVETVAEVSDIDITSDIVALEGLLSKEGEINLYRIVQECLNNIVKHSQATAASVTIYHDQNRITLSIEDNGCGFDTHAPAVIDKQGRVGRNGLGLTGIAERARILKGSFSIASTPEQGTVVAIEIPTIE
jgi:signal transduction histidine kinase/ligand-binding sensor domain-containing protein